MPHFSYSAIDHDLFVQYRNFREKYPMETNIGLGRRNIVGISGSCDRASLMEEKKEQTDDTMKDK